MRCSTLPPRTTRETVLNRPIYKRRWFVITALILAIPVLAVAWYLGSPLFIDKTVIEEFPQAAPLVGQATDGTPTTSTSTAGSTSTSAADEQPGETTSSTEAPATTTSPAGPIALRAGTFVDGEPGHSGSGSATIYELEDGSRVLRFEGLDVTNGPDLHVILTSVAEPTSTDDVMATGYLDLGGLKGNKGDQNYEIPGDFDVSQAGSVVIYCAPFHVIFATASLTVP